MELAGQIWSDLGEVDYLEAFAAHPKIGTSKPPDNAKNTESWTSKEQAGMMSADEQTKLKLKTKNQKYAEKFGYIFIVCATGKSASEILELLRIRLENSPETELEIAAGEQMKITNLRLNKMLRGRIIYFVRNTIFCVTVNFPDMCCNQMDSTAMECDNAAPDD